MPNTDRNKQFWAKNRKAIAQFGESNTRPQERKECVVFLGLAQERNRTDHFPIFRHPFRNQIEEWTLDKTILTNGTKANGRTDCILVENTKTFQSMIQDLSSHREIALDAEMSLHHQGYHGSFLCILQISTLKTDYIIDVLKMAGEMPQLKQILESPTILKIFHGGDNDILALQADYKLFVVGFFDMQLVYQKLFSAERPKFEKLVQKFLNEEINVDKTAQCADWTLRPLPTKMLRYAREDSRLLLKCWISAKPLIAQKLQEDPLWINSIVNDCKKLALRLKRFKPQKYIQNCVQKIGPGEREMTAAIASHIINSARITDMKPADIVPVPELAQIIVNKKLTQIKTNRFITPTDKLGIEKCMYN